MFRFLFLWLGAIVRVFRSRRPCSWRTSHFVSSSVYSSVETGGPNWPPSISFSAFPYESASKFLLFDHDQKYGPEVRAAVRSLQIGCVRTSIRSPWQNGVAERWVGSCRRDLLDHIIAVNERHLKRLLADYIRYYHDDRTHLGLRKQTPGGRLHSAGRGSILSHPRLGGLHHRYDRAA